MGKSTGRDPGVVELGLPLGVAAIPHMDQRGRFPHSHDPGPMSSDDIRSVDQPGLVKNLLNALGILCLALVLREPMEPDVRTPDIRQRN